MRRRLIDCFVFYAVSAIFQPCKGYKKKKSLVINASRTRPGKLWIYRLVNRFTEIIHSIRKVEQKAYGP